MTEYNLIKKAIEKQFDKSIQNRRDCEQLSVMIYEKTGKIISYNTIRRFYNLAGEKNITKISSATLDIFANFCGSPNYEKFLIGKDLSNTDLEYILTLSLKYQQESAINIEEIKLLADQHFDNPLFYNFINDLVFHAFLKKDIVFIKALFSIIILFENKHYLYSHIYYLIQTIGIQLRNYPEIQEAVWEEWAKSTYGRQMYFELFVDMDYLFTQHYKGMEAYLAHSSKPEELLFSHVLLFWRIYFLGDNNQLEIQFEAIKKIDLTTDIHPIPIARSLSCTCVYEKMKTGILSEQTKNEISYWITTIKTSLVEGKQIPNFHFWLCEGLIVAHENELVLALIQDVKTNYFNDNTYFNNGGYERLKVYEALAYARLNNNKKAKILGKLIDRNRFFAFSKTYDSCFYYALQILTGEKTKAQVLTSPDGVLISNLQLDKVIDLLISRR
jgi:hypothetical protein